MSTLGFKLFPVPSCRSNNISLKASISARQELQFKKSKLDKVLQQNNQTKQNKRPIFCSFWTNFFFENVPLNEPKEVPPSKKVLSF